MSRSSSTIPSLSQKKEQDHTPPAAGIGTTVNADAKKHVPGFCGNKNSPKTKRYIDALRSKRTQTKQNQTKRRHPTEARKTLGRRMGRAPAVHWQATHWHQIVFLAPRLRRVSHVPRLDSGRHVSATTDRTLKTTLKITHELPYRTVPYRLTGIQE